LPILMRVSYNTLIVKQNTSDYYKYSKIPCKNMKKLIKTQDINVFIFQSVIIINFSYPQFLVCGRIYHK
jgi:hypothetical protein